MKILGQAKNGQITHAIKTYEELSETEREALRIPATSELSNYKNFQIRCNKKGEKLNVSGYEFSEEYSKKLNERVDFVDALETVYGKKGTKRNNKAKERINTATKNQGDNAAVENESVADIELIKELLASEISAYRIAEITGISRTTISNYRNGKSDILNMALSSAIELSNMSRKVNLGYYDEI